MFEKDGLNALYAAHRDTLNKVVAVETALRERFYCMDHAIECLMIAAMSGEAMVMIGPPGTAKSRLIRAFCNLLELIPDDAMRGKGDDSNGSGKSTEDYFEYLLTQFTEPNELFGFYDLSKLDTEGLVKKEDNMMQRAKVVFLDEMFNASSAILNSLLTFMNERKFHDRGEVRETPLRLLVSATNHPPREESLGAVYDRFLLRCRMNNLATRQTSPADLADLLQTGWQETHAANLGHRESWSTLLDDLKALQDDVNARTKAASLRIDPTHPLFNTLAEAVSQMVTQNLSDMSNRRIIKLAGVMLSLRLLRGARDGLDYIEMQQKDLSVILQYSLDREDPSAQARLSQELEIPCPAA